MSTASEAISLYVYACALFADAYYTPYYENTILTRYMYVHWQRLRINTVGRLLVTPDAYLLSWGMGIVSKVLNKQTVISTNWCGYHSSNRNSVNSTPRLLKVTYCDDLQWFICMSRRISLIVTQTCIEINYVIILIKVISLYGLYVLLSLYQHAQSNTGKLKLHRVGLFMHSVHGKWDRCRAAPY